MDTKRTNFLLTGLYWTIRIAIGLLFVYAGFIKLIDPKSFAHLISQYNLIPEFLLGPVAFGLPLLEIIAGLGLIFNIRGSLTTIFGLLVVFVFILWYGILNDLNIDCGCFTPAEISSHGNLRQAFYRDLVMIAGILYVFFFKRIFRDYGIDHTLWLKKIILRRQ
jgi:uncharacterized membrane protein YphA (DoxX/SURF4 family)